MVYLEIEGEYDLKGCILTHTDPRHFAFQENSTYLGPYHPENRPIALNCDKRWIGTKHWISVPGRNGMYSLEWMLRKENL